MIISPADSISVDDAINAVRSVEPSGGTNILEGFGKSFELLEPYLPELKLEELDEGESWCFSLFYHLEFYEICTIYAGFSFRKMLGTQNKPVEIQNSTYCYFPLYFFLILVTQHSFLGTEIGSPKSLKNLLLQKCYKEQKFFRLVLKRSFCMNKKVLTSKRAIDTMCDWADPEIAAMSSRTDSDVLGLRYLSLFSDIFPKPHCG